MPESYRGIIGPFPPIWRMQEVDFRLDEEIPDPEKIKIYEQIIKKFSEFHGDIDRLRDKLARDIEKIIEDLEPRK